MIDRGVESFDGVGPQVFCGELFSHIRMHLLSGYRRHQSGIGVGTQRTANLSDTENLPEMKMLGQ